MKLRPARLLFAFVAGLSCTVILAFPAWSSGTILTSKDLQNRGDSFAKMKASPEVVEGVAQPRLVIKKSDHTLTVQTPGKAPVTVKVQGAYLLPIGARSVIGKELNPVWKAPPTYFLRRGLPVPADDSPARLKTGALGSQALMLEGAVAIHSGAVWSDDVGGVKVSAQDMALLFDAISIGATVEVV